MDWEGYIREYICIYKNHVTKINEKRGYDGLDGEKEKG